VRRVMKKSKKREVKRREAKSVGVDNQTKSAVKSENN
jgi:hypothetical protein